MESSDHYVYQTIAKSLVDHEVHTLFGLMGDANLFMVNDFVRSHDKTFVPVAFEGSAVLMALSYSKFAHSVGVATVTHGPGFTNCITALAEGVKGNTSMVLLCGDTPVATPQNLQNIDQRELTKATGAGFVQMRTPKTATEDIARAFYQTQVERRPVVLNMPADFMWEKVEHNKVVFPVFNDPVLALEGDNLDEAIGMLASAKRPVILAGGGAIGAEESLIRLADRLEAPLATTLKAKAMFNNHPFNMDIFGTLSTPAAYEAIDKSDCVAAFGASLHHFTTDRGALMKGKRVIQINDTLAEIGKNYHPDAALVGDAELTANNILKWLDDAEIPPSGFTKELNSKDLTAHPPAVQKNSADGALDFVHALEQLDAALPDNRILTTDGGRFMTEVWCRVKAPDAKSFIATTNFGSIGIGLQHAIGACFAVPNRPVVLFTGDGGFMMAGINEFNTAVRLNQDLITIVCNDSAYGAEHIQFVDKNIDPSLSQFEWPSFADVATALGGQGIAVETNDQLGAAIEAIKHRDRPLLIELMLDPDDVPRMRI